MTLEQGLLLTFLTGAYVGAVTFWALSPLGELVKFMWNRGRN